MKKSDLNKLCKFANTVTINNPNSGMKKLIKNTTHDNIRIKDNKK